MISDRWVIAFFLLGLSCVALILQAHFRKDESPPRWTNVCAEERFSHFITIMQFNGNTMVPLQIPQFECIRHEMRCVAGKDYRGSATCGERA